MPGEVDRYWNGVLRPPSLMLLFLRRISCKFALVRNEGMRLGLRQLH